MESSEQEQRYIAEMQQILQEKMARDYPKGATKRDAHPKSLGLLTATFTVLDDLPPHLQAGIFKKPHTYSAWIRSSNANGDIQSDRVRDLRGFAIKLIGVEGKRFSTLEKQTQDLILLSNPTIPLGTVKLFRDAVYYSIKWNPAVLALKFVLSGHGKVLTKLFSSLKKDTSPLDINYWSTTPYQLGSVIVKYKLVPTSAYRSEFPETPTNDYLTQNMVKHLKTAPATFDFYVQVFKDEETTPTEDAAIEWKEEDSPFIRVATLEIPKQTFDTKDRLELAEMFSFSPANSLLVHRPIGGLNRARIVIYEALSKFRHGRDTQPLFEPTEVK